MIASLALFIALGGSATAATLITGAKVKNGTITGKDIKSSSLTGAKVKNGSLGSSDLSTAAKSGLKGAKGDQGPAGQTGPPALRVPRAPVASSRPGSRRWAARTSTTGPPRPSLTATYRPAPT